MTDTRTIFDLTGRRALVTGASRGIGRALAVALADAGADVLAVARTLEDLQATAAAAPSGRIRVLAADLSDPVAVRATVDAAVSELGGLDILVNNAGTTVAKAIEDTTEEEYSRILQLDLESCWLMCRAASPALKASGHASVINIASMLSTVASLEESAYIVAKHGLLGLTRALGIEWARAGVRVNAIGPGYVDTAMTTEGLVDDRYGAWVLRNTPQGRWASPEEMAGAAIFLASDASAYMTGQIIVVDGGWTAQ